MCDKNIHSEQWYHGLLPREDIKVMLRKNGDFLVRSTEPKQGEARQYVLSAMHNEEAEDAGIKHYVLRLSANNQIFLETKGFDTTPIVKQEWEIEHSQVELTKKLGEGAFGEVWKGKITLKNGHVEDAAIKSVSSWNY
uniref:SH2 domain-containing protein n=1 Tax=Caenorhabditis japonica TaxID=281687 RepID=A0A8R1IM52_CAEJA